MPVFELGENTINLSNPVFEQETDETCPTCEESKLVVQEQESRYGHEFYLECADEECGACFYPVETRPISR